MKRSNFVWCDDCGEDVAIPHNSKDCADKWKRECIIARNGISRQASRISELETLVQRHEAALEFVASNDDDWSPWRKGNGKAVMIHCGQTMVNLGEHDTPLAAIEAAMKRRNEHINRLRMGTKSPKLSIP